MTKHLKQHRILHVDDDRMILNIASRVLESAGFDVTSVEDPTTDPSIDYHAFSLLLFDWIMPTAKGMDLCRAARKAGFEGPILVLSSKDLDREERHALTDLNVQVMSKPFGPHLLIGRVRELLTE